MLIDGKSIESSKVQWLEEARSNAIKGQVRQA